MTRLRITGGLLIALAATACEPGAAQDTAARYDIPSENLLTSTFAGEYVSFVYGDAVASDDNQIGLVFEGKEVAAAIPGFKARAQGYIGLVDARPSAVVETVTATSNFDEMLVANVERAQTTDPLVRYKETDLFWNPKSVGMFDLTDQNGGWHREDMLPPGCRIAETQFGGEYHSCLFRLQRDGFEYSFHLNGENVAFADAYADFVRAKLDSWKID